MKIIIKVAMGIISFTLFLILIFLISLRFQIFNKSFLLNNLEKHNFYQQLPTILSSSIENNTSYSSQEKKDFKEFVNNISPEVIKPLVVNNLVQIMDYFDGKSKDITISFALQGVGFQNASGIKWSLSQNKNFQLNFKFLNGVNNILTILIVVFSLILIMLLVFSAKIVLFSSGIGIFLTSLISKIFLSIVGNDLIKAPTFLQKILGTLSLSLFSDIITIWLVVGIVIFLLWLFLEIKSRYEKNLAKT